MYADVGRTEWNLRLVEMLAIYIGLPVALAFALPPFWLFPGLFGMVALSVALLRATPGFRWRELTEGWRGLDWRHVALVASVAALAAGALVWWLVPHQALYLPRHATGLWLLILLLYPILSALPQELIFRALFFRRYGALFPSERIAMLANGVLFGAAHLMFWNWVAVLLSAAGGLIFAHGWLNRGGFPMAVVLHAVCGAVIFTVGLGRFFYHGAIGAP